LLPLRLAKMPPRCRGLSGFRDIRARPSGTFYDELRDSGFGLTLGTYDTPELAARAYNTEAWQL
jgi:hypothetical protein